MRSLQIALAFALITSTAWSDSLPTNLDLLGAYRSDGVYNLVGLGTLEWATSDLHK